MAEVEFKSKMQALQFEALKEQIDDRNSKVAQINAATGERESVYDAVAESNDDENLVNLRIALAEAQEAFDAVVNEKVDAIVSNASEGSEGLMEEVKEIDSVVRAGLSYYKKLYGDESVEHLPKVVRLKGKTGGGGKRIRGYSVIVTDENGEVNEFENAATAAKHLGADTATLQSEFFAKAGVEKLKDAPDEVEFRMEWTEVDDDESESEHYADVKFYRTGESGVPSKDENSDDEEAEAAAEAEDDGNALEL